MQRDHQTEVRAWATDAPAVESAESVCDAGSGGYVNPVVSVVGELETSNHARSESTLRTRRFAAPDASQREHGVARPGLPVAGSATRHATGAHAELDAIACRTRGLKAGPPSAAVGGAP